MKKIFPAVALCLVLAIAFIVSTQTTSSATECRIVRILAFKSYQDVTLDPKTAYINKGDCVIWFNNAANSDVKITFEDAKSCTDVVEASMDFKIDEDSCLVTKAYIPNRGTASFVFDKEGSFEYSAEVKGTSLKIKGTIQVR